MERLDDVREEAAVREAAIRFLAEAPTPAVITRLVQALQDDDFGVRWTAATVLAQHGEPALREVLTALTDPQRVGDPRLRDCAYHILHNNPTSLPVSLQELLAALRGPAADIAALVEADRVLRQLEQSRSARARAPIQPDTTATAQLNVLRLNYGPAQLTGRLSRLGKHW